MANIDVLEFRLQLVDLTQVVQSHESTEGPKGGGDETQESGCSEVLELRCSTEDAGNGGPRERRVSMSFFSRKTSGRSGRRLRKDRLKGEKSFMDLDSFVDVKLNHFEVSLIRVV